jgi:hypothetical protein
MNFKLAISMYVLAAATPCFAQKAAARVPSSRAFQDEMKLIPDKTKNPWITSTTVEGIIRGYSKTLARLLKEEQQDKQRTLPIFLVSNGPGVLWSATTPNAAHTSWQEDRDGDVWTIKLLDPPLPPDDPATSPTKLVLNRDKWELYDKENKLIGKGSVE